MAAVQLVRMQAVYKIQTRRNAFSSAYHTFWSGNECALSHSIETNNVYYFIPLRRTNKIPQNTSSSTTTINHTTKQFR